MKKLFVFILILLVALAIAGCSNDKDGNIPEDDEATVGNAYVSFIGETESTGSTAVAEEDLIEFSRDIYKEPFSNNEQGKLVKKFTPKDLIAPINEIGVAHPNYSSPLMLTPYIEGAPKISGVLFNIAFSNKIIDAKWLSEEGLTDFEVTSLTMFTKDYYPDSNNNFGGISEVRIDMGEEYKDVVFANEDEEKKDGTVHVFQLSDLIPLEGDNSLIRIQFDHNVNKTYIINPDGSYVGDFNPYFWEIDGSIGLDGYVIYRPGIPFGLTQGNKNLIFSWKLHNLIEVYDNNSDDPNDYLVTLRLDNPFPIDFRVENYEGAGHVEGDGLPPEDVSNLEIRFFDRDESGVYLRWLNPAIEDLETVHVVRKEGSKPTGIDDGTKIYSDRFPAFADKGEFTGGASYYYKVYVENTEGLLSDGVSISVDIPDRSELYWEKSFEGYGEAKGVSIIESRDDEFIIGASINLETESDMLVLKIDEDGEKVWEKTFGEGSDTELVDLIMDAHDGSVILGNEYLASQSNLIVKRLDYQGNLSWEYSLADIEATSIHAIEDEGYFITANIKSSNSDNIYLLKLDDMGNKLWDKTIESPGNEYAREGVRINDGGTNDEVYIIAGETIVDGETEALLLKINSSGEIEERKTFAGVSESLFKSLVVKRYNDEIWVGGKKDGQLYLVKVDSQLNIGFEETFGTNGVAYDVVNGDGGYTIVAGRDGADACLIKMDWHEDVVWEHNYGGNEEVIYSVLNTKDGSGYMATGEDGNGNIYLIKLDYQGRL